MLKKIKRNNLLKLADFLENNYSNINFDMKYYKTLSHSNIIHSPISEYKCETVACALGYGPLAGIKPLLGETWGAYGARNFVDNFSQFDFIFGSTWRYFDNTPLGAAARIRYFLDHEKQLMNYCNSFDPDLYKNYIKSN